MKTLKADLQADVVAGYDKTKTSMIERVTQRTINSQTVMGPPPSVIMDIFTTTAGVVTPYTTCFNKDTNRFFAIATGTSLANIVLFNFNEVTFSYSYVGRIQVALGGGTHTVVNFTVDDNSSDWQIVIGTVGSVLSSGGEYIVWKVNASDFTPGGTFIPSALGNDQKATYLVQDPASVGISQTVTTLKGAAFPNTSANPSFNTKIFAQNGTAALPQVFVWDYKTTPNIHTTLTVSAQTTPYAGTSPSAYFTTGAVNPLLLTSDQLVFLTSGPSNFTVANTIAVQVAYFARDVQLVLGNYYFNLATTITPGAAVVPATSVSNFSMIRAYGISTNTFSHKTGVLAPAMVGTALATNSVGYTVPTNAPANIALNGQDCLFTATNSTLYLVKLSDLTNGATSWSSLTGVNAIGNGLDITAPTPAIVQYSSVLDRWVFTTNTSKFVVKKHQNSVIDATFGGLDNKYLELTTLGAYNTGFVTISSIDIRDGILFVCGSTVGQRITYVCDLSSDSMFDISKIITKVLDTTGKNIRYINLLRELFELSASQTIRYRTASTESNAIFNTASGGWTTLVNGRDQELIGFDNFTQFEISSKTISDNFTSPCQVNELLIDYVDINEISDNWEGSVANTDSNSPAKTAFRLIKAYSTSVPTLHFRAYDDNNVLVASANTSVNPSMFEYSTDNGTSWNPLGTIPNTVNTEVRYNWVTPPGVKVTVSIREE